MSLFARLTLLLLAVIVPPLIGLGAWLIDANQKALTIDAQHYQRSLAERAQASIDDQLERARVDLASISEVLLTPAIADADDASRLTLVGAQLAVSGQLRFVTVYDAQGDRQGTVELKRWKGTAHPPAQLAPELREEGGLKVGAPLDRDGKPVLQLIYPARASEGVPPIYLYTELQLESLCALVGELGEAPPLRSREAVYVVDANRVLRLHADLSRVGQSIAKSGVFTALGGDATFRQLFTVATEFDGAEPMLGSVAAMPQLGWAVVVQQPQSQAYATLKKLKAAVALAVAFALVLAIALGVFGVRAITRPLAALVVATKRLASREWTTVDPSASKRSDEIGGLARAFDQMTGELKTSERKLVEETQVRTALSRYLPGDVVELVVKDPTQLKLGGEKRYVTVLFADVVGFTRLSESLPPETIVSILNELFTFATEIVHQRGGIVDKFIGDCVMAVWGVPHSKPDDAQRAVLAAEDLRRWLDVGNRRWRQKFGVELQLAMGVHSGDVVAGNVGSERRVDYTVIGDTVNVAARLEALATPGQILVSESTRQQLVDPGRLEPVGEQTLRGRSQTTKVYEVRS